MIKEKKVKKFSQGNMKIESEHQIYNYAIERYSIKIMPDTEHFEYLSVEINFRANYSEEDEWLGKDINFFIQNFNNINHAHFGGFLNNFAKEIIKTEYIRIYGL